MINLIFILLALLGTPLYFNPHIVSAFDVTKLCVLYSSAMGLGLLWLGKGITLPPNPLNLPIAGFFVSFVVSTAISINPFTSLFGEYKRYEGLVSTICYLILFYSIASITSKRHVYIILLSMVGMSVPIASYGILQHFGYDFCSWSVFNTNRVFSTFGNPVFFAAYLAMIIPIALSLFFTITWLFLPVIALLLSALAFTASRAAFVGLAGAMILFFSITWQYIPKKRFAALMLSVIILTGFYLPFKNTFMRFNGLGDRPLIYHTGLEIIKDYPAFGVGPDCVGVIYDKYLTKYVVEKNKKPGGELSSTGTNIIYEHEDRIHADILDTLATRGIFGLGTYIWLLVSFGIIIRRYFKSFPCPTPLSALLKTGLGINNIIIMAGLVCGLLAWFIQQQVMFSSTPINIQFWGMLGLCIALSKKEV